MGKDVPAAIKSFRKAAEQDHVQAMINLGVIYNEGHEGSPPDRKAAAVWLGRAASHNDADAQWLLGKLHYDGHIGDKPDMFEAMKVSGEPLRG